MAKSKVNGIEVKVTGQTKIKGLGWRDVTDVKVWNVALDELAGWMCLPLLNPGEEDVVDDPLTLWASDNGFSVDDLCIVFD